MKLTVNGLPLEIFEGATVEDAIRKFSKQSYREVKDGKKGVFDMDGNKFFLQGELTGGEVLKIEKISQKENKMNNSKQLIKILGVLALFLILFFSFLGSSENSRIVVTIFHMNDIHGKIDNMGKVAFIVERERKINSNVFLVEAGDNFSGNPIVDQYDPKGEPLLILMNKLKFNAGAIGNHDFDYGQKILKSFISRANFPLLCSNIEGNKKNPLGIEPYTILKTDNGFEITILGLIQTEKSTGIPSTLPKNVKGFTFFEGKKFAERFKNLKKENNLFIALSHLGFEVDKLLAQQMGELDIIIGGHSHTLVEHPSEVNGVLIAQAGSNGNYLGKIDVVIEDGKVIEKRGSVIDLNEFKESNPDIDNLITSFSKDSPLNKVIATINSTITGRLNLGLMVTDAVRENLGLDMIFYNKGGIRINKLSGNIRIKDIYAMHPFGNYIVKMRMDTSEIKDLIKNDFEAHRGIDIIPSGLSYRVTRDLNRKVINVELFDLEGYKIQDKKFFDVGLNNYIVSSYKFKHKDPGESTNAKTVDIMLDFFKNLSETPYYSDVVRSEEKIVYTGKTKVLGKTDTDIFTAHKKFYDLSTSGNLITDAIKDESNTDFVFYPTRLLRSGLVIKKGKDVYKEALPDLYNFLKRSKIVVIKLTGKQLVNFVLNRSKNKNNIDLQISGGSYKLFYDKSNGIRAVELYDETGLRIDPEKNYSIALVEYEFNKIYSLKKISGTPVTNKLTLDEIVSRYITKIKIVPKKISVKRISLISGKK